MGKKLKILGVAGIGLAILVGVFLTTPMEEVGYMAGSPNLDPRVIQDLMEARIEAVQRGSTLKRDAAAANSTTSEEVAAAYEEAGQVVYP